LQRTRPPLPGLLGSATLCLSLLLGPALAIASGDAPAGEPHGVPFGDLAWHGFNLLLLLGLIFFLARRPVSDALRNRSTAVRRSIEDAQQARQQARAQLEELEEKLADFELQVERLRKEMADQAEHEQAAIISRAERESQVVRVAAERAIRDETLRARRELQHEAVGLAVRLAEEILASQVSDADQQSLARELLETVAHQGAAERGIDHGA